MYEVKKLNVKNSGQGLELAIKAVHERGLNNIDFDKTDFSDKCKMLFVSPAVEKWGLFVQEEMVGFLIASLTIGIWNKNPFIEIMATHILPEHRHINTYQQLMNHVYNFAREKKVTDIKLRNDVFILQNNLTFLTQNGFAETSQNWEKTIDY
tara:strand:- start:518 stop:973 length:456 start_codon:yes stop_codon:yes gene_type:complete